jgi:RNA polymerase sigma-70 factor (ECF subfamily)
MPKETPSPDRPTEPSRGAGPEIVTWVRFHVIPHEAEIRRWIQSVYYEKAEVDDIIQDIYFKLLRLDSVRHITDSRAYLYQAARNAIAGRLRRKRIVSIRNVQNLDDLGICDRSPSPERVAAARAELKWVLCLIANLPDRCSQVMKLRKIYGLSQAEAASRLAVTENIIEKETIKGVKLISEMAKRIGISAPSPSFEAGFERTRDHGKYR